MSDRPDFLPPVETIDGVPDAALPATALHLAAMMARLAARMATVPSNGTANSTPVDELLDIKTAGALVRRSASWMRHHGRRLPGFCQPEGKGTRVQWSRRALEAWLRNGLASHTPERISSLHAATQKAGESDSADDARHARRVVEAGEGAGNG